MLLTSARYERISSRSDFVQSRRLWISSCPARAGFRFPRSSHTPQGVFSSFTGQTPVCPFTRAIRRVFIFFPTNGSLFNSLPIGKRNPASGWTKSGPWPVEILSSFGRNLQASPADGKARRTFVLRALFTLAAIYSRGTCRPTTIDVLMFHFRVRNGTGWDHQAMTTRFQGASLCSARCLPR